MKERVKVVTYGEASVGKTYPSLEVYNDKNIEELWEEFEDVLFIEEENGALVLNSEWNGFDAGTDRETIWHWFDNQHSKGINWLLNGTE